MELSKEDDSDKHLPSSTRIPPASSPPSTSGLHSPPPENITATSTSLVSTSLVSTSLVSTSSTSKFTSEALKDVFGECSDNLKEVRYEELKDFHTFLKTKCALTKELDEIVVFLCQIAVYENTKEYKSFSCPALLKDGETLNYLAYNSLLVMLKHQCNTDEERKEVVTCILHVLMYSFASKSRDQVGFGKFLHANLRMFVKEITAGLETSKWLLKLFVIFSEKYCDSKYFIRLINSINIEFYELYTYNLCRHLLDKDRQNPLGNLIVKLISKPHPEFTSNKKRMFSNTYITFVLILMQDDADTCVYKEACDQFKEIVESDDEVIQEELCKIIVPKENGSEDNISKGRMTKKRVSKEKMSKGRMSKETTSKERMSKEEMSKEDMSKERMSKERMSKERMSKERMSKERMSKERKSKERMSKEGTSKENLTKDKTHPSFSKAFSNLAKKTDKLWKKKDFNITFLNLMWLLHLKCPKAFDKQHRHVLEDLIESGSSSDLKECVHIMKAVVVSSVDDEFKLATFMLCKLIDNMLTSVNSVTAAKLYARAVYDLTFANVVENDSSRDVAYKLVLYVLSEEVDYPKVLKQLASLDLITSHLINLIIKHNAFEIAHTWEIVHCLMQVIPFEESIPECLKSFFAKPTGIIFGHPEVNAILNSLLDMMERKRKNAGEICRRKRKSRSKKGKKKQSGCKGHEGHIHEGNIHEENSHEENTHEENETKSSDDVFIESHVQRFLRESFVRKEFDNTNIKTGLLLVKSAFNSNLLHIPWFMDLYKEWNSDMLKAFNVNSSNVNFNVNYSNVNFNVNSSNVNVNVNSFNTNSQNKTLCVAYHYNTILYASEAYFVGKLDIKGKVYAALEKQLRTNRLAYENFPELWTLLVLFFTKITLNHKILAEDCLKLIIISLEKSPPSVQYHLLGALHDICVHYKVHVNLYVSTLFRLQYETKDDLIKFKCFERLIGFLKEHDYVLEYEELFQLLGSLLDFEGKDSRGKLRYFVGEIESNLMGKLKQYMAKYFVQVMLHLNGCCGHEELPMFAERLCDGIELQKYGQGKKAFVYKLLSSHSTQYIRFQILDQIALYVIKPICTGKLSGHFVMDVLHDCVIIIIIKTLKNFKEVVKPDKADLFFDGVLEDVKKDFFKEAVTEEKPDVPEEFNRMIRNVIVALLTMLKDGEKYTPAFVDDVFLAAVLVTKTFFRNIGTIVNENASVLLPLYKGLETFYSDHKNEISYAKNGLNLNIWRDLF